MREIKFRAIIPVVDTYDDENNPINFLNIRVSLHDIIFTGNFPLCYNSKGATVFSRDIFNRWIDEGNAPDLFTGIKDINGIEIFERDIVRFQYIGREWKIGFIEFLKPRCGFLINSEGVNYGIMGHEDYIRKMEVIGNIHNNRELSENIQCQA